MEDKNFDQLKLTEIQTYFNYFLKQELLNFMDGAFFKFLIENCLINMYACHLNIFISLSLSFQAKKFVESLPQNVKEKVSKEEADEIKKVLEAVGGTVEIEV